MVPSSQGEPRCDDYSLRLGGASQSSDATTTGARSDGFATTTSEIVSGILLRDEKEVDMQVVSADGTYFPSTPKWMPGDSDQAITRRLPAASLVREAGSTP